MLFQDEEETQEKKKEFDIYVPPKISAAYYGKAVYEFLEFQFCKTL